MALDAIKKGAMGLAALFTVTINSAEDAAACVGKPGPASIQFKDERVMLDPAKAGESATTKSGVKIEVLPGYKFQVTEPDGKTKILQGYGLTRSLKPKPVECGDMFLKE